MDGINELLLAQVWNAQWLAEALRLTSGEPLRVVYRGVWTHGLGPDFSGALLDIGGRLVAGDVEIHLRASGWLAHGHQQDPAYDEVVLHVVLDDDLGAPVRRRDGGLVPALALRPFLLGPLEDFPGAPRIRPLGAIGFDHCAPAVAVSRPDEIVRVWEAAGDARLAGKVAGVAQRLSAEPPAQVLYALLLDALGYTRNREGMAAIAGRLPYDHIDARLIGRDTAERTRRAAALLLGVAGFLPLSPHDAATGALDPSQVEAIEASWRRDGAAWHDIRLPPTTWTLVRQRPAHHPLRRLLALARLLGRVQVGLVEDLCARVMGDQPLRRLRDWLTGDNPYLGTAHAHEIVVNVVVPFALAYGDEAGDDRLASAAADLWDRLPAGRGTRVTRRTAEQICGPSPVPVRSARAEQGLLHIQRTGCAQMRCFECPIAHLALRYGAE